MEADKESLKRFILTAVTVNILSIASVLFIIFMRNETVTVRDVLFPLFYIICYLFIFLFYLDCNRDKYLSRRYAGMLISICVFVSLIGFNFTILPSYLNCFVIAAVLISCLVDMGMSVILLGGSLLYGYIFFQDKISGLIISFLMAAIMCVLASKLKKLPSILFSVEIIITFFLVIKLLDSGFVLSEVINLRNAVELLFYIAIIVIAYYLKIALNRSNYAAARIIDTEDTPEAELSQSLLANDAIKHTLEKEKKKLQNEEKRLAAEDKKRQAAIMKDRAVVENGMRSLEKDKQDLKKQQEAFLKDKQNLENQQEAFLKDKQNFEKERSSFENQKGSFENDMLSFKKQKDIFESEKNMLAAEKEAAEKTAAKSPGFAYEDLLREVEVKDTEIGMLRNNYENSQKLLNDVLYQRVYRIKDIISPDFEYSDRLNKTNPKLHRHCIMVADCAYKVAELIGADKELAYAIGIFHEAQKVFNTEDIAEELEKLHIPEIVIKGAAAVKQPPKGPISREAGIVILVDEVKNAVAYAKSKQLDLTVDKIVSNVLKAKKDQRLILFAGFSVEEIQLIRMYLTEMFE